ncbi:MAG: twin-arginine translocation signal domain-containing protein, partial [Candidatus Eremiobacteraeota bacterium]|nr:twin-arginine translocation signal domain-containing protein [Candidatus Eremiobacteraeota bacterium]
MKFKQTLERQRNLQQKRIARRERVERRKRVESAQRREQQRAAQKLTRRLEEAVVAAVNTVIANPSRRDFLRHTAGAGLALGLSPLLASCGGSDSAPDTPPARETQTLFFNLAHEDAGDKAYYLTGGGQRYALTRVSAQPEVLARERQNNKFLRGVPDDQITHHVENVVTASDSVTLFYSGPDIDPAAGTWSMSYVFLQVPTSGAAHAYRQARARRPSGPLPLSAKRKLYGLPPAESEQDLREERVLIDTASLAAALVGTHPDLLSLEPNSAHNIQSNHIDTSIDVVLLAEKLRGAQYGPAMPQQIANTPNATGWGTLVPLMNETPTGIAGPVKNQNGKNRGRIQYQPILHPDIAAKVGPATGGLTPAVKNDAGLGADITAVDPMKAGTTLSGAVWFRHDGSTNVDQSPGKAVRDASVVMTLKQDGPQNGIQLFTSSSQNGNGTTQVSLTLVNWYVRFLGVYLQFLDDKNPPNVIPLKNIPEYNAGTIIPGHDQYNGLDTGDAMFVSVLGPEFTILGIPVAPGNAQSSFTVPASAHTVRILSSGLSFSASNPYADTVLAGAIMTGIINYGMTAVLAGAGAAAGLSVLMSEVVVPLASALAQELVVVITDAINDKGLFTAGFWESQGLATAKYLLGFAAGKAVGQLVSWIVGDITVSVLEDEIPVAGLIMLAISIAAGLATIAETSIELAYSPW